MGWKRYSLISHLYSPCNSYKTDVGKTFSSSFVAFLIFSKNKWQKMLAGVTKQRKLLFNFHVWAAKSRSQQLKHLVLPCFWVVWNMHGKQIAACFLLSVLGGEGGFPVPCGPHCLFQQGGCQHPGAGEEAQAGFRLETCLRGVRQLNNQRFYCVLPS